MKHFSIFGSSGESETRWKYCDRTPAAVFQVLKSEVAVRVVPFFIWNTSHKPVPPLRYNHYTRFRVLSAITETQKEALSRWLGQRNDAKLSSHIIMSVLLSYLRLKLRNDYALWPEHNVSERSGSWAKVIHFSESRLINVNVESSRPVLFMHLIIKSYLVEI
jgi:hypothetical protein